MRFTTSARSSKITEHTRSVTKMVKMLLKSLRVVAEATVAVDAATISETRRKAKRAGLAHIVVVLPDAAITVEPINMRNAKVMARAAHIAAEAEEASRGATVAAEVITKIVIIAPKSKNRTAATMKTTPTAML